MSYQAPPPSPSGAPYPAAAYQSYGYPAQGFAPPRRIQPLAGLATAASVLLGLVAGFAVLAGVFFLSRASAADDFLVRAASVSDLNDADNRVQAGVALFFTAFVAAGVVFIIWQFRHAKNAEAIRGSLPLGPGWAIGGWFIPLANYVLPAIQLGQAAKASDPDLPSGAPRERGRLPGIIIVWAVTFGIGAIVFLAGSSTRPSEDDSTLVFNARRTLEDFARSDRVAAAGMFVYAIGAVLALVMVRTLTNRQKRAASSLPPPQPYYEQPPQPYYQPQPYQQPQTSQQPQTWQPPPSPAPPPPAPPPPAPPPPP